MISIPSNLAQRILEAARIAAAIHHEQLHEVSSNAIAGGAGALAEPDCNRGNLDLQQLRMSR
jgi:hypothetical protein